MISAVLFDLDGTLIDTEPSAAEAIRHAFEAWGLEVDPSDAHVIAGRTWERAFNFLFEKYSIPVSKPEAEKILMDRYRHNIEEELHVVPGGPEAVIKLAERYPLALVSGSFRSEILWALDQLKIKEHFQVILGAEDYAQSKPAPDGYSKAIRHLNVKAASTLIFEDSQPGIESGRSVGAWVVAITSTNHFGHDTSLAHHHIPDLRGVDPMWVDQLIQKHLKNPK